MISLFWAVKLQAKTLAGQELPYLSIFSLVLVLAVVVVVIPRVVLGKGNRNMKELVFDWMRNNAIMLAGKGLSEKSTLFTRLSNSFTIWYKTFRKNFTCQNLCVVNTTKKKHIFRFYRINSLALLSAYIVKTIINIHHRRHHIISIIIKIIITICNKEKNNLLKSDNVRVPSY